MRRLFIAAALALTVAGFALVGSPADSTTLPARAGSTLPLILRLACNGLTIGGTPAEVRSWLVDARGYHPEHARLVVSLIQSGHREC